MWVDNQDEKLVCSAAGMLAVVTVDLTVYVLAAHSDALMVDEWVACWAAQKDFELVAHFGESATKLPRMVPLGVLIFRREIHWQKFVITLFFKYYKLKLNEIVNSLRNQDSQKGMIFECYNFCF